MRREFLEVPFRKSYQPLLQKKIYAARGRRGNAEKSLCFGILQGIFHGNPFHPLGEQSSSIVFPNFLSSHMQGSAFLCDLCDSAVKNETPTADSRMKSSAT
jgi:hypothetical protein